ncbi:hypothetical protein TNIN_118691 [Trichonephila inaurata madagascariensis]|uniref:Uncharacterized protein n=1 Tax=Trichonephila inaurata madagascariensis TaxID=2747483 RepID=A0A8X6YC20_9ARAC|nr:hypothetical protein TNIN_118691 [Trichonephila inaurata madagascariensis]
MFMSIASHGQMTRTTPIEKSDNCEKKKSPEISIPKLKTDVGISLSEAGHPRTHPGKLRSKVTRGAMIGKKETIHFKINRTMNPYLTKKMNLKNRRNSVFG